MQISLEIGQGGPRVNEALATLTREGKYSELAHMVETAPPSQVRDSVRQLVATPAVLANVLAAEPINFVLADRLIALLGAEAAAPLVDTLAESDSRSARRNIVTRLVALGSAIVPVIMTRLDDERWYVVRNLLGLIADLPELPFGFSAAPYTTHIDPRVRRQALKMQMLVPEERERALALALADRDEEVVRLGLFGLERDVPDSLVPRIVQLSLNRQEPPELRHIAIRALGHSNAAAARDTLVSLVDGGRTWLRRTRLAPRSPEMLAALHSLAVGWAADDEPARFLARARESGDPVVRAAMSTAGES